MADRNTAVIGVYREINEADRAVYELLTRMSLIVEVSVLSAGAAAALRHPWMNAGIARGAATGSLAGSVAGAALGGLASAGVISTRLLGVFADAGPVVGTLGGAVVGAVIGGLVGSLVGAAFGEAPRSAASGDGVAVSVHCGTSEEVERVTEVLEQTGAAEITERPESVEDAEPGDQTGIAQAS